MFAFDVGLTIDLNAAGRTLREATQRKAVRRPGRAPAPAWFEYEPAPLRVVRDAPPVDVGSAGSAGGAGGARTEPFAECTVYDFGAISILYRLPIDAPLSALPALSAALYGCETLLAEARAIAQRLADGLGASVAKPTISPLVEDYAVFALREWTLPPGVDGLDALVLACAPTLAQVLQGERSPLSPALAGEAVRSRLSFTPSDAALIDWNCAVLFDREPDDLLVVLEHANVELLEMRVLDAQLDALLERARAVLAAESKRRHWPLGPSPRELQNLAELQTDSSLMFEGVNNALKLFGDQYLARVYRLAAERLHLPNWDAAVLRKLATAESIHNKITGFRSAKRMEVLELVIVILIAVSIVLPFLPFGAK
jgi:hypothetical protein